MVLKMIATMMKKAIKMNADDQEMEDGDKDAEIEKSKAEKPTEVAENSGANKSDEKESETKIEEYQAKISTRLNLELAKIKEMEENLRKECDVNFYIPK